MQNNSIYTEDEQKIQRHDADEITRALDLFFEQGGVTEVRMLDTEWGTVSGYFDNVAAIVRVAAEYSGRVPGVYITLNRVRPDLLARSTNRVKTHAKTTTSDADITRDSWFLIDADPARPKGISATDAEHELALKKGAEIKAFLKSKGWPWPVLADSGNGAHVVYQIDLPNDDASRELLKRCLEALDFYFTDKQVQIDRTVFKAAQIFKLYGTRSCKGDNGLERPHRLARIIEVPDEIIIVSREQLEQMAAMLPEPPKAESKSHGSYKPLEIEKWMADHGISIKRTKPWQGGTVYELNECPVKSEHNRGESRIIQFQNGALSFGCFHNACADYDWHALRDMIEPGWRDKKSSNQFNSKVLDAAIDNRNIIDALREIAKLEFEAEQEIWVKTLSAKTGVTLGALKEDLKRLNSKAKSQNHQPIEQKPIDLLTEQKPRLHPATDLINGKFYFGTSSGANPILIYERQVLTTSAISQQYELAGFPNPLRMSVNGIKTYINGGEIRGPRLYNQIHNLLSGHVIFKTPWQIVLTVIWIIGTYLHRCFPLYPYLCIQSPTKRCGKTRLLELIAALGFNSDGLQTTPTEAVLYRQAAITGGTLCWDEAESLGNIKDKSERNAILNVAYRKGGKVSRCEGENHEVKDYEVFRPIALAGISALPDTASDRSLRVELIRKRRDEKVERLRINHLQCGLQSLRDGLHIFALERAPIILEFYGQFRDDLIPEEVDDRLREAFEIIISIAAGIYYHDKSDFPPIHSFLQMAAKGLSGIRALDEDETSFIKAIGILRSKIKESKQAELVVTTEEAIQIFQAAGLTWVQEPKHAQSILRKLDLKSEPHRVKGELIRGYKITAKYIEDQFLRYGSAFAE